MHMKDSGTLQFVKGSENVVANFLSRPDEPGDNFEIVHITIHELRTQQEQDPSLENLSDILLKLSKTTEGILIDSSSNSQLGVIDTGNMTDCIMKGANSTIRLIAERYM